MREEEEGEDEGEGKRRRRWARRRKHPWDGTGNEVLSSQLSAQTEKYRSRARNESETSGGQHSAVLSSTRLLHNCLKIEQSIPPRQLSVVETLSHVRDY